MREHRRGLSTPLRLADADGPGKASTARSSKLPSSSKLPVEITTPSPATAEGGLIESRQRCRRTESAPPRCRIEARARATPDAARSVASDAREDPTGRFERDRPVHAQAVAP
jgi:hypothetical protein